MKLITKDAGKKETDLSDTLDKLTADLVRSLFRVQKLPVCSLKYNLERHTVHRIRDLLKVYGEIRGITK